MFSNDEFLQLGEGSLGPCVSPGTPSRSAIPGPSSSDFGMADLWGADESDEEDSPQQHLLLHSHEDPFASINPWKDASAHAFQSSAAAMSWGSSGAGGSDTSLGRYSKASSYQEVLKSGSQEVLELHVHARSFSVARMIMSMLRAQESDYYHHHPCVRRRKCFFTRDTQHFDAVLFVSDGYTKIVRNWQL